MPETFSAEIQADAITTEVMRMRRPKTSKPKKLDEFRQICAVSEHRP
jgi:hypothetical protein